MSVCGFSKNHHRRAVVIVKVKRSAWEMVTVMGAMEVATRNRFEMISNVVFCGELETAIKVAKLM